MKHLEKRKLGFDSSLSDYEVLYVCDTHMLFSFLLIRTIICIKSFLAASASSVSSDNDIYYFK